MSYPRALLVDLDDTVIDYGGSTDACWRTACEEAGRRWGLDAEALLAAGRRIGHWYWSDPERHRQGRADLLAAARLVVERALVELGYATEPAGEIAARYRALRDQSIRLFPGAVGALERLREAGVRLAMVTNGTSTAQRAKIERFDLARHFEHILVEGEFGVGKPDARVYRAALAALGSRPEESWFVGDNLEWDVASPQRLGLRGIWVDSARAGLPSGTAVRPDRIIHALAELA